MANINRHNYEAFFLDYIEGNLSPSEEKELIEFIEINYDLKKELNDWEDIKLTPSEEENFTGKPELKKNNAVFPNETPFEEQCIAKFEGDLSQQEENLFDLELKQDINKYKTYKTYEKTKLFPDQSIVYPGKKDLKARDTKTVNLFRIPLQPVLATAASITLIVGLFFNTKTNQTNSYQNYSTIESIKINKQINKKAYKQNYLGTNKNDINNIKDLNIDIKKFLPIAKVEVLNTFNSSYASIEKIQSISITDQKLYSFKADKKQPINQKIPRNLKNDNNSSLFSLESTKLNPKLIYANKGNSNFSLLDIADLSFKGISKLTGKEIALKRTYNKNGELKKLAFKTETFSISTKVKD
jgi:hypothetical protein